MFKRIRKSLLKQIYNLLIFRAIVTDRSNLLRYKKLHTFCVIELPCDKGVFKFNFKKDMRSEKRLKKTPGLIDYVIELEVPENLVTIDDTIRNKVVIVVKIVLFKIDYEILTELLMERYLDKILHHIQKNR